MKTNTAPAAESSDVSAASCCASSGRRFTEFWSQQVVGAANGSLFKVAKEIGSTNWHAHADQDVTFVILRGHDRM